MNNHTAKKGLLVFYVVLQFVGSAVAGRCDETDIVRLTESIESDEMYAGRVEICMEGVWSTVCINDNRSHEVAQVVCRQLQLPYIYVSASNCELCGQSEGMYVVGCDGSELSIQECEIEKSTSCSQFDLTDVICRREKECEEGNFAVYDDNLIAYSGNPMICHKGMYRIICDRDWDIIQAEYICHINFNGRSFSFHNHNILPPRDSVIAECGIGFCSLYYSSCLPTGQAGIACYDEHCTDGHYHLVGGDYVYEGRLEYCHEGNWYTVCADDWEDGGEETQIICGSMGIIDNYKGLCDDGQVRLVGNSSRTTNGEVEFCQKRGWKRVCMEEWDHNNTEVFCKELNSNGTVEEKTVYSEKSLFVGSFKCNGSENHLSQCKLLPPHSRCTSGIVHCEVIGYNTSESEINIMSISLPFAGLLPLVTFLVMITYFICRYKEQRRKREETQLRKMLFMTNRLESIPPLQNIPQSSTTEENTEDITHSPTLSESKVQEGNVTILNVNSLTQASENVSCDITASYRSRELIRNNLLINETDITLMEPIGEGQFGIVYKGVINNSERQYVAIKTLKGKLDKVEVDLFLEECLKMGRFKHENVMNIVGVCLDTGSAPYLIMPYMANGSLLSYLIKEKKSIILLNGADEDEVKEVRKQLMVICLQIAKGMEYLAAEKYIHRDLASRNCMIDDNNQIKITDFGLSEDVYTKHYFRHSSYSHTVKLPVKWMAPESLSDGHFSEKSDVWSYGVTMWEIFSGGKTPYPGIDPRRVIHELDQGYRMPKPYNNACTNEIYGIMRECWQTDPKERPTFKDIASTVITHTQ